MLWDPYQGALSRLCVFEGFSWTSTSRILQNGFFWIFLWKQASSRRQISCKTVRPGCWRKCISTTFCSISVHLIEIGSACQIFPLPHLLQKERAIRKEVTPRTKKEQLVGNMIPQSQESDMTEERRIASSIFIFVIVVLSMADQISPMQWRMPEDLRPNWIPYFCYPSMCFYLSTCLSLPANQRTTEACAPK